MTSPEDPAPGFDVLPLSAEVRRAVDELGYTHPTPVQRAVFEQAGRGVDLVVQARTGTGKTAAFGLPLLDQRVHPTPGVQALILCPTRELALQITRELTALGKYRGITVVPVYGGAPMGPQVDALRDGAQVVVGTPGRVLDHLGRRTLNVSGLRAVVLDESDEMLSMGFLPQINAIFAELPKERQTLLFSATLPPAVQRMAETRLRSPEWVTLSGDHVGALQIQHFFYSAMGDKVDALVQMIEVENPESAIIFCNTKDDTRTVAAALQRRGYAADWLNADLAQSDREKVMAATRASELRFLVATDVAARGIDISHLTHVINFGFPDSTESYVHRTGRTGRAGRTGTAISMVGPSDVGNVYLLRLTYGIRPIERRLPSAQEVKSRAEADVVVSLAELFRQRPPAADDLSLARRLLTHDDAATVVAGLLRAHLGERPELPQQAAAERRAKRPAPAPVEAAPGEGGAPPREPRRRDARRPDRVRDERPREDRSREDAEPREAAEARQRDERPREPVEAQARDERPREAAEARPREAAEARPRDERPRDERGRGRGERRPEAAGAGPDTVPTPVEAEGGRRRRRREAAPEVEGSDELDLPGFTVEGGSAAAPAPEGNIAEIFVNVGERHGAGEDSIRDVLDASLASSLRYVKVRPRHSYVGVEREALDQAVAALNGATIAGRQASAEPARPR